jgi:hypothetical protein
VVGCGHYSVKIYFPFSMRSQRTCNFPSLLSAGAGYECVRVRRTPSSRQKRARIKIGLLQVRTEIHRRWRLIAQCLMLPPLVVAHTMRRMRLTRVGFGLDRLDPHRLQQPRHALVIHGIALAA